MSSISGKNIHKILKEYNKIIVKQLLKIFKDIINSRTKYNKIIFQSLFLYFSIKNINLLSCGHWGYLEELVVMHKDRLARFGYELIEHIINKYSNGNIKIVE